MSSSTYHSVDTCPHCGHDTLASEQNDFSGYCDKTSTCSHCGYWARIDAGCGPWETADFAVNRKDGIITAARYCASGDGTFVISVPGSLHGAQCFLRRLDLDRVIFQPAGESPQILGCPVSQTDDPEFEADFARHLAEAKSFFDRLVLTDAPSARI